MLAGFVGVQTINRDPAVAAYAADGGDQCNFPYFLVASLVLAGSRDGILGN